MANGDTQDNEIVSQAAPDNPPDVSGPVPGPDLSSMVRPGASIVPGQPSPNNPHVQAMENLSGRSDQELQAAIEAGKVPPPHVVTGKERLLAMIQGLAVGLGSAATSIATHGQEGGAAEVVRIQGEQQQQKLQAQAAQTAQRNAEVQQHLTAFDTIQKQIAVHHMLASLPTELTKDQLSISGEQQRQGIVGADFMNQNWGLTPEQITGKAPLTQQNLTNSQTMLVRTVGDENRGAMAILGKNDPAVKEAQRVAGIPNPTAQEIASAGRGLVMAQQQNAATTEARTKQHAADPLYKLESDPTEMEGAKSTSAISMLQNRLSTETDPVQKARGIRLLAQANNAHSAWQADERSKEAAHLAAISGDPVSNGQMLAEGDLTLADMKSRGTTTKSITDSVREAKKYAEAHGKTYNASDEIVGETALKGQTNQNFYGSARSFVQQGGMLDQLKTTHDNLGNTPVPGFNQIADWTKYQAGTPELSAYKQAVLAAADDYAKVMGGGNPTIEQFNALRDGFAYQLNNAQLDTAVDVARKSVRSQIEGRIGPNNYIRKRMGDILQDQATSAAPIVVPSGTTGKVRGSDGKWYYHDAKSNILGTVQTGQ